MDLVLTDLMMLLFIVFITALFALWLASSPFIWIGKGIEWRFAWPIVGNVSGLLYQSFFDYWLNFYNTFKDPMIGFHLVMTPALLLRDPELIKQVAITDSDSYSSRGLYAGDYDIFRSNLFWVGGEEWKYIRSKMTPYFTPAKVKSMVSIIEASVDTLIDRMRMKCMNGPIDIDDFSIRMSADVIVSTAFGMQSDCFTNPKSFFYSLQQDMTGYKLSFRMLMGLLSGNWFTRYIYEFFKVTVFPKEANEKMKYFTLKTLNARLNGEGVRPDLIQGLTELYLKEKDMKTSGEFKLDGKETSVFDENGVTAQSMVSFYAGTDTVAHALTFTIYELAKNVEVQDRLRREIIEVKSQRDGTIGYNEINQMTYLDMVVSESLRLHPVVPAVPRQCVKPTRLGNLDIPVGTTLIIPIVGIHRDSEFYPNPDVFDPERFAPGITRDKATYIPFGIGPRTCIGSKLAEAEIKLSLFRILTQFKVEPCSYTPSVIVRGFGPTTGPRYGIPLYFKSISS